MHINRPEIRKHAEFFPEVKESPFRTDIHRDGVPPGSTHRTEQYRR
jgi:hypothetical protein